jgi:hypothetical protein
MWMMRGNIPALNWRSVSGETAQIGDRLKVKTQVSVGGSFAMGSEI